jgi:UDP-N-acetylmuramyl pentapeptide phosphotransferase/UDP-N-acetylglucosamine-1-phosphate transferase
MRDRDRRTSQIGLVVAGGVVIVAGFAVGVVEALGRPKGSIWLVVVAAVLVVAVVRWLTRRQVR